MIFYRVAIMSMICLFLFLTGTILILYELDHAIIILLGIYSINLAWWILEGNYISVKFINPSK